MPDWGYSLLLLGVVAATALAWTARTWRGAAPAFDRIERGGGSVLLGTGVQSAGYWLFQPLARGLVHAGVSANAITWTSLAFGVAAGVALGTGRLGLGAFLGALSFVLDAMDGLVARLAGTANDAGEVLDAAIDRYVEFAWLGGLAVHWRQDLTWLILAQLALLGSVAVTYASAKAEALHATVPRGAMRRVERCVYLTVGAAFASLLAPWQDTFAAISLPPEWPMRAAVLLIAIAANVSAVRRFAALARSLPRSAP